ncbi:MAG: SpoIIE family protein phosphatase [Opitutales bacterium]|jgi:sigma-B regulation protein RsbU (phosphoserine phosphatase)
MGKKRTWSLGSKEAKIYLHNLLENITDAIYFKDEESRFLLINEACRQKHGFKNLEDTVGKTDADVFTEEHANQALRDEQKILESGEPIVGVEEMETWPDGSVTWVSTTKMPLRSPEGELIGTFGISRDITDKKEADLLAARYAGEIQRLNDATQADLRMAGELQKAFFPKTYPVFPPDADPENSCVEFSHYSEACGLVGGDLCSIKAISDTEAGVFLCDVMGHGIRAALGTAIVRSLIEEFFPVESDPGKFMMHLNQRICPIFRQSKDLMFITALYLIINTETGKVRFCSAGHPRPVRYSCQAGLSARIYDPYRSPALALFEDCEYTTVEQPLNPGDMVLIYTDGVHEATNPENEQYGKCRLTERLSEYARQPINLALQAIISELHQFSDRNEFEDDICLVGLKWKGPTKA